MKILPMKMSIATNFPCATFIQLWQMESQAQQQEWLRCMHGQIHLLQSKPGFQSMILHPSLDGLNVVVYAQWASPTHLQNAAGDPQVLAARGELDTHGQPDGTLYRVDSVYLSGEVVPGAIPIVAGARALVFVNFWKTQSEKAHKLLGKMKSETPALLAKPGACGIAYHVGLDGTRLAVYALWDSAAAFSAAISNSQDAMKQRNDLAQYGTSVANTYRIDSVYLARP